MEQLNEIALIIALTMGTAWAAGINLYAAILVLGILGSTGNIHLPPDLQILMDPLVLGAAGIMYAVEFFADKVPGLDNGWDALHTFIRIPAGALMAAGAVGDINPALAVAAAILGGGIAAGTHVVKAGTRVMINTSPEPFSNIATSLTEDLLVVFGLWTALQHPWFFILLMVVFLLFLVWVLPKIWKAVKIVFSKIVGFFKGTKQPDNALQLMSNQKKIES
ncbi:MAG: DUF4126 domain-containing protein [Desulfobacterales bacterium]